MTRMRLPALLLAGALLAAAPLVRADEVTDQLDAAAKAYQRKDLTAATAALDAASGLLRQMRAEAWKAVLPPPLPGWTAKDAESVAVGPAMLGGGTSVSRSYHRAGDSVEVSLIADSPLLQGLGSLMASGIVSGDDMKIVVLDGRRATYTKSDNSYQTMVAGKAMVIVKGSPGLDDQTLRSYLGAVKFDEIEKAAR